jgi:hypothetical protein
MKGLLCRRRPGEPGLGNSGVDAVAFSPARTGPLCPGLDASVCVGASYGGIRVVHSTLGWNAT